MSPAGYKFLSVTFSGFVPTTQTHEALKELFDKATDWAYYGSGDWIIYTNQSPQQWLSNIQTLRTLPAYNVLIAPIDPDAVWGWHQQWLWDWFKKPR
jgi:hypothetical protein